ncbi:MAG TPA: tetratricopeptide repeat protein [Candidatus Eremiobacteraceae bacterium]
MRRLSIAIIAAVVAAAAIAAVGSPGTQAFARPPKAPVPSPSPSQSPTPTPQERIATLRQTVKDNPNDSGAHADLGQLLVEQGDPQGGRDQLETAIGLGADDERIWFYLGSADIALNDPTDAAIHFEKAGLADPSNVAVLANLVDIYLQLGRLDDAERLAKRGIALHPDESFGYEALGTVQLNRGSLDDGRKSLLKALSIDPKDSRAKLLIGKSYMADKKPNYDLALAQFDAVLVDDPKNPEANMEKAGALAAKGDVPGAVAVIQTLVKLYPDTVEYEDDIAQTYLAHNMESQARAQFAQAVKDHPKDAEPFALQAEYDQSKKNYTLAATEFDQAIALAPANPRLIFDYARMLLLGMKQTVKAQDMFARLVSLSPNDPEAVFWLGQSYAGEKQWAQARDEYKRSFSMSKTYVTLFNLGLSYFELKDYKDAREAFEALAANQDPKHPDAQLWYVLGDTYRLTGDKRNAIVAFKQFLNLVPKGSAATKAHAYLKQLGSS